MNNFWARIVPCSSYTLRILRVSWTTLINNSKEDFSHLILEALLHGLRLLWGALWAQMGKCHLNSKFTRPQLHTRALLASKEGWEWAKQSFSGNNTSVGCLIPNGQLWKHTFEKPIVLARKKKKKAGALKMTGSELPKSHQVLPMHNQSWNPVIRQTQNQGHCSPVVPLRDDNRLN